MPMKSFLPCTLANVCNAFSGARRGRWGGEEAKATLPSRLMPFPRPPSTSPLDKSVAMPTSKESQKPWRQPAGAICFAPQPPSRGFRPCIWLSHRQEYKPFLRPVCPQCGYSGSGTTVAAEDLSLTQVYCSHQLLLPPWLLTIAPTFSSLFSEFALSPYPKFSALGSQCLT